MNNSGDAMAYGIVVILEIFMIFQVVISAMAGHWELMAICLFLAIAIPVIVVGRLRYNRKNKEVE